MGLHAALLSLESLPVPPISNLRRGKRLCSVPPAMLKMTAPCWSRLLQWAPGFAATSSHASGLHSCDRNTCCLHASQSYSGTLGAYKQQSCHHQLDAPACTLVERWTGQPQASVALHHLIEMFASDRVSQGGHVLQISPEVKKTYSDVKQGVKKAVAQGKDKLNSLESDAESATKDLQKSADKTGSKAQKQAESVQDKGKDIGKDLKSEAKSASKDAGKTAEKAGSKLQSQAESAGDKAKDVGKDVKSQAQSASKDAGKAVDKTADKAQSKAEDVGSQGKQAGQEVKSQVGSAGKQAGQAADQAGSKAKGGAQQAQVGKQAPALFTPRSLTWHHAGLPESWRCSAGVGAKWPSQRATLCHACKCACSCTTQP